MGTPVQVMNIERSEMVIRTEIRTPDQVSLSDHAEIRAQQRGVRRDGLVLAALYGESIRAGEGSVRRTLTSKAVEKMVLDGYSPQVLESAKGTVAITREDPGERVVVTVGYNERDGKRRGGFHKQRPRLRGGRKPY